MKLGQILFSPAQNTGRFDHMGAARALCCMSLPTPCLQFPVAIWLSVCKKIASSLRSKKCCSRCRVMSSVSVFFFWSSEVSLISDAMLFLFLVLFWFEFVFISVLLLTSRHLCCSHSFPALPVLFCRVSVSHVLSCLNHPHYTNAPQLHLIVAPPLHHRRRK